MWRMRFWQNLWVVSAFTSTLLGASSAGASYDVVVAGSEPEGIAAAVASARSGLRTLLVSSDPVPGGIIALARLNMLDMNTDPEGNLLTRGFFQEFYRAIGNRSSFEISRAEKFFQSLLAREKNITLLLNCRLQKAILQGNTLTGIECKAGDVLHQIFGRRFIDATGDGDLAAISGVPFFYGREDFHQEERMADTLIFEVGGVDWKSLARFTRTHPEESSSINAYSAQGFRKITQKYPPSSSRFHLRGLNIGRERDGSVLINALLIFGVNPFDLSSVAEAMQEGREEARRVVEFLRSNLPGFERAFLLSTAEKLYVRETRHMQTEYTLKLSDVLENHDFPDSIAVGSYPVDHQPVTPGDPGIVYGKPSAYAIPFRSLVPLEVENLLIVGRCAGYSSLAAGSARVVPLSIVEGEVAGYAAFFSIQHSLSFRQLAYSLHLFPVFQNFLKRKGILVHLPVSYPSPFASYPEREALLQAVDLGLFAGGYTNDFHLNDPLREKDFSHLFRVAIHRSLSPQSGWTLPPVSSSENYATLPFALQFLSHFFTCNKISLPIPEDSSLLESHLTDLGLSSDFISSVQKSAFLTRWEGAVLMMSALNRYREKGNECH